MIRVVKHEHQLSVGKLMNNGVAQTLLKQYQQLISITLGSSFGETFLIT